MKQWQQKKSLCFFLIIGILFLGVCAENIQADSFFSYESSTHSASSLLSGERTTLTTQEYLVSNISKDECITNSNQVIPRSFIRNSKGTALCLLFVNLLPLIFPLIQTSSDDELTNESYFSTIIINYIHHKDGKKA